MKALEKTFDNQNVRIREIDGDPWFVVVDVCRVLGMSNPTESIRNIHEDDLSTTEVIDSMGRNQKTNIVNESGLYDLVFKSRKEEARKFRRWVTKEVLPSIRKTGKYEISDSLKKKSTNTRNLLTDEWQKSGVSERWQFGNLTLEEYRLLQFEKGKKKPDLNEGQIKTLLALEAMEMLNLHYNPVEGYIECKESLKGTAQKVIEVKNNKEQIDG